MKKQAKEWISFAETDLKSAKVLIKDESLTTTAAFHVQQCVEKSLKALLELNNRKIPRIHDLLKLIRRIDNDQINISLSVNEEILDQINQVYIDARYPADFGLLPEGKPSTKKVEEFINEAENVFKQTEQIIEKNQNN